MTNLNIGKQKGFTFKFGWFGGRFIRLNDKFIFEFYMAN